MISVFLQMDSLVINVLCSNISYTNTSNVNVPVSFVSMSPVFVISNEIPFDKRCKITSVIKQCFFVIIKKKKIFSINLLHVYIYHKIMSLMMAGVKH